MEIYYLVKYCMEECAAKRKRFGDWQYHIETMEQILPGRKKVVFIKAHLPMFAYKRKPWKDEKKEAYLEDLQEELGKLGIPPCMGGRGFPADNYHDVGNTADVETEHIHTLYTPEVSHFLTFRQAPLSFAWGKLLLETRHYRYDRLVLLDGEGVEIEAWIRYALYRVRNFFVVTHREEILEGLQEALLEEYGITIHFSESIHQIAERAKGALLVAGRELYDLSPQTLLGMKYFLPMYPEKCENLVRRSNHTENILTEDFCRQIFRQFGPDS